MPLDRCLKCDCEITPDPTFRWRLCAGCRAENFGLRRPDGKGDPHPTPSEFAETVMLVDARDEIDPGWREVPLETIVASGLLDYSELKLLMGVDE